MREKPKVSKVCACGETFETAYPRKIRCSLKCSNKYNSSRFDIERNRDWFYKQRYGITLEEYNKLYEEQEGCCKVCNKHQMDFKKRLHVDHSHETGQVRGLLCPSCNLAIGMLMDDPKIIKSAWEYVSLQVE